MKKLFIFLLFSIILSCEQNDDFISNIDSKSLISKKGIQSTSSSLLWNPGPTKKSYLHINHMGGFPHNNNHSIEELSDLSEGNCWAPNRPGWTYPNEYPLDGGSSISAIDKSAPSFLLITEGYMNTDYGSYPGFDFWVTEFLGTQTGIKVFNNTKYFQNTSKLREVGFIFNHWYNENAEPRWAFKEQYRLSDFKQIRANFDARLDDYDPHLANDSIPTVVLSADLRINYYDDGEHVRGDLLSVIFCNPNNLDIYGTSSDDIYWQGYDIIDSVAYNRISIHSNKVGITSIIPTNPLPTAFTHINFDFVPLIINYLPDPPNGLDYDDAIIVGYDIYSSTRGADITFSIKDIDLIGIN